MDLGGLFFSTWLKFFFIMTPFFVFSMYLSMTGGVHQARRRKLVFKIVFSSLVVSLVLLFFGNLIFELFGITLDSFRIGGGALLFLSAVGLVNNLPAEINVGDVENNDIAVVPLAIPITIGPGTTGALLVLGAETNGVAEKLVSCVALIAALGGLCMILLLGEIIEKMLGKRGIVIMSKLTGLVLAALASQMIFTGVAAFLKK